MEAAEKNRERRETGRYFQDWFHRGSGAGPGYRFFRRKDVVICAAIGIVFSIVTTKEPWDVASGALLPVAGILFAVGFALVTSALSLLSSRELREVATRAAGGLADMANYYQLIVTTLLGCGIVWGVIAAGPYHGFAWTVLPSRYFGNFLLAASVAFCTIEIWSASNYGRKLILIAAQAAPMLERIDARKKAEVLARSVEAKH